MNEIPFVNVDDWKDVLSILIIVVGGWVTTFITLRRGQKRVHESHNTLNEQVRGIKEQVGLLTDMHGMVVEQTRDIGRVRDDLHGLGNRIDKLEGHRHRRV